MASVELKAGSARNEAIQIFITYDDVTLRCTRLRWVNTSGETARVLIGDREFTIPTANSGDRALPNNALNMVVVGDPGDTSLAYDRTIEFGSAPSAQRQ